MYYLYPFFFFLVIIYFLKKRYRYNTIHSNLILIAFTLKTIIGCFFIYYFLKIDFKPDQPSDVYRFFQESKILNNVFYKSPSDYFKLLFGIEEYSKLNTCYFKNSFLWIAGNYSKINESRNLIRIHSIIQFISFNNPYIHVLIFNLFTTIGLKKLSESFNNHTKIKSNIFFIILLIIPSLLFWTSGILKESFILIGIGFTLSALLSKPINKLSIINFSIGLIILIFFKTYILLCLIPSLIFILTTLSFKKHKLLKAFSILTLLLISLLSISEIQHKLTKNISKKQLDMINVGEGGIHLSDQKFTYYFTPENYKNLYLYSNKGKLVHPSFVFLYDKSKPFEDPKLKFLRPNNNIWKIKMVIPKSDSYFKVSRINDSFKQLIFNIPEAISNALFRPFNIKKQGVLQIICFFETIIISLLIIFSLLNFRKINQKEKILIISILIFVITLLLLIGWTTPISGVLVRFRFPAQLGLILVCLVIIKFKNKFIFNE